MIYVRRSRIEFFGVTEDDEDSAGFPSTLWGALIHLAQFHYMSESRALEKSQDSKESLPLSADIWTPGVELRGKPKSEDEVLTNIDDNSSNDYPTSITFYI